MPIGKLDFEAIDSLDFKDRFGTPRTVYGCSILGKKEFDDRLLILKQHLDAADGKTTIDDLYLKDEYFRYNCDRCLTLNGIEPDWVNEQILTRLLFLYNNQPGLLVLLNMPERGAIAQPGEKGATPEDLVAALWAHTENLREAIDIAKSRDYPAKQVAEVMHSRSKLAEEALREADPKEYYRRKSARIARERRSSSMPQPDQNNTPPVQPPETERSTQGSLSKLFKVMASANS